MVLLITVTINIIYYNVRMNADHIFDPGMNLMLSLTGYLIFLPIIAFIPAIVPAIFMDKNTPFGNRWIRSFWICLLGFNVFLVGVMIVNPITA